MFSELSVAKVAAEPGLLHVILVHHGQSQNDENTRHMDANQTDPGLSALGQQQASLLGARLGAQLKEAAASGRLQITCSTMQRALQTAYPLSLALRQSVLVNPELVEQFGFFTSQPSSGGAAGAGKEARFTVPGPLRKHVSQRYPTYDASLVAEELVALEEDEAQAEQRARRIASALQVEALNSPDGTERILIIISHADFLAKLACALLGIALNTALDEYGDGAECGGAVPGGGPFAGVMPSSSLALNLVVSSDRISSSLALNHCATCHLVLRRARMGGGSSGGPKGSGKGSGKSSGKMTEVPPLMARLLHWNRTDHLAEVLRSGISWVGVSASAASWARHGEGGTGSRPSFDEAKVVETLFDGRGASTSAAFTRIRRRLLLTFLIGMLIGALIAYALSGEFGGPRIIMSMTG